MAAMEMSSGDMLSGSFLLSFDIAGSLKDYAVPFVTMFLYRLLFMFSLGFLIMLVFFICLQILQPSSLTYIFIHINESKLPVNSLF